MIDKDTHDNWKLDNGESHIHHCDDCHEEVNRESDLNETTGCNDVKYICNICTERYDICFDCNRPIIHSEYGYEGMNFCCDSCIDKKIDSMETN